MTLRKPQRGLFVTGTDTEVGKTYVAASIARTLVSSGVSVGVYKPVASGCRNENGNLIAEDALTLWQAAGQPLTLGDVCPQRFEAPLAPHLAARAENQAVDAGLLRHEISVWHDQCEFMIVEGVGGLMSPISDDDFVADVAADFGYPLIVVAANALGAINQTLQTLITAAAYRDGLPVAGVILNEVAVAGGNDLSRASNRDEIARWSASPVLCCVPHGGDVDCQVDWFSLADCTRDVKRSLAIGGALVKCEPRKTR